MWNLLKITLLPEGVIGMKKTKYLTGLIVGAAAGGAIGMIVESMANNKTLGRNSKKVLRKAGSFISGMF